MLLPPFWSNGRNLLCSKIFDPTRPIYAGDILTFADGLYEGISADHVIDRLHDLQYGEGQPVLLFTQDPTGLGGQISRRLLGLKLALLFGRKVVFPSLAEPPYGQIFEPLHSPVDYAAMQEAAVPLRAPRTRVRPIVKLDFWDLYKDRALYSKVRSFVQSAFTRSADPELHFTGALLSFCRLTPAMSTFVTQAALRLDVKADTLGVHIRRGDKSVETPFIPIAIIQDELARLCELYGFQSVFACSDDESVFDQLKLPAGVNLIFDQMEKRYNNANHRFLIRNPELAAQETRTAVKNIFLLGRCGAIVGQSNAHFARLAASQITCRNDGGPFGTLIAGDHVLQHSPATRHLYKARHKLRALARLAFPWMTLRDVGRKLKQNDPQ